MKYMIPVVEAKEIIEQYVTPLPAVKLDLLQAAGCTLAENIVSNYDIPAFPQSAMDGYAFAFADYEAHRSLSIHAHVQAGAEDHVQLNKAQAARIFTGAPVPGNADTVVMQEKVLVQHNEIFIQDDQLTKGLNVRPKGSEISKGQLGLPEGTRLMPAALGFLAGIGVTEVMAYPKPVVHIIVTGKELQQQHEALQYGKVYESNSFTLMAALQQLHINDVSKFIVDDDLQLLQQALEKSLALADLVLLTGGVSVGDYDFVVKANELCGVIQRFHKIKQRPGKPLYFGTKDQKLIFGLPGNPSSVLTCFYEYVIPAINKMCFMPASIQQLQLALAAGYSKKEGLTHFLKGRIIDGKAQPLTAQESYRLASFATADCLIVLEEERSDYTANEVVEVHLLPR
jgi:molybdopterin molybdotransferase